MMMIAHRIQQMSTRYYKPAYQSSDKSVRLNSGSVAYMTKLNIRQTLKGSFFQCCNQMIIGGGSIYKVGGPDAERRRCQRDGEGLRGGVRNLYQLFISK